MNGPTIKDFLESLGIRRDLMVEGRGYINSVCPMSKYLHARGIDTKPSFGVKINLTGESFYYCFGCTPCATSLGRLVHNVWLFTGKYPYDSAKILSKDVSGDTDDSCLDPDIWVAPRKVNDVEPLPFSVLNRFPLLQSSSSEVAVDCKNFLFKRGISIFVQNYLGIRFDPNNSTLIFPLTGVDGKIYMLRARSIRKKKMWTISPELLGIDAVFPRLSNSGAMFALNRADMGRPIMLVEGEIDCARLVSLGYTNVVASATCAVAKSQLNNLLSGVILLGYDSDLAGSRANSRVVDFLKGSASLFKVNWKLCNCKDAGDLKTHAELKHILENIDPVI